MIDFHTHAFPEALAVRAMAKLDAEGGIPHYSDGTVRGLLASMFAAGIERSVLCSIATKPAQFADILAWSLQLREEHGGRIVPLVSVHPQDEAPPARLATVREAGLVGIKMHAYYQDFLLDDPALFPLYEAASDLGLIVVQHCGFDVAFPRLRRADATRILNVTRRFPGLKLVAAHVGGWDDWDEAERLLIGRPVYLELSFGVNMLEPARFKKMLLAHPQDYLLFGTDSPWTDQKASLEALTALDLPDELFERITSGNARRLLGEA